jgi:hypothetical protein
MVGGLDEREQDLSATSPGEESDANLSPVVEIPEPTPGRGGVPVRCELCWTHST